MVLPDDMTADRAETEARPRRGNGGGRSGWPRAALGSVALHGLVLACVVLWLGPHALPEDADQGAKVELLMVEKAGGGPPTSAHPPAPVPPHPPTPSPAPAAAAAATAQAPSAVSPAQPPDLESDLPLPPVPPPAPPAQRRSLVAAPAQPPPPAATAPLAAQTNLGGTDSATNAIARGDDVVPARPDAQYRNRPPVYPRDAALRGEQGAVTLLIHISPAGLPIAVEVTTSSGFLLLDRAAQEAVEGWHFLPAERDGAPVAAEMPLRVRFELDDAR
jgi:protein TonB